VPFGCLWTVPDYIAVLFLGVNTTYTALIFEFDWLVSDPSSLQVWPVFPLKLIVFWDFHEMLPIVGACYVGALYCLFLLGWLAGAADIFC
jgi:hypothetical protein